MRQVGEMDFLLEPTGPTDHLNTVEYWRDLYNTSVEVGNDLLTARDRMWSRAVCEEIGDRPDLIERIMTNFNRQRDHNRLLPKPEGGTVDER